MSMAGIIPHERCDKCGDEFPSTIMQTYALAPDEQNPGPLTTIRACLVCVSEMAAKRLGQKEPFDFAGDPIRQRNYELTKSLKEAQGSKRKRSTASEEDIMKDRQESAQAKLQEQEQQVKEDIELDNKGAEERDALARGDDVEQAVQDEIDAKKRGGKKNPGDEDEDTEDMVDKSESTRGSGRQARRNS